MNASAPARRFSLPGFLPSGAGVPDGVWRTRHRIVLGVLFAHVPVLVVLGLALGDSFAHSLLDGAPIAVAACLACRLSGRSARSMAAATGLLSASAMLVHLTGGLTEMHFHFLVVIALLALYEDWRPFLLALGFVMLHHGLVGTIAPTQVYAQPAAQAAPFLWAAIHGLFVAALAAVCLVVWRQSELLRAQAEAAADLARASESEFRALALEDPLTGVPNARALQRAFAEELIGAEREDRPVAAVALDLDHFKAVNDLLGHDLGNEALRKLVEIARGILRSPDTVARTGGDEFVLVLPGCGPAEAHAIVARLRLALASLRLGDAQDSITFSAGIATYPRDGSDVATLLRRASAALYQAKR